MEMLRTILTRAHSSQTTSSRSTVDHHPAGPKHDQGTFGIAVNTIDQRTQLRSVPRTWGTSHWNYGVRNPAPEPVEVEVLIQQGLKNRRDVFYWVDGDVAGLSYGCQRRWYMG
jgi:hypothetical protein